MVKWKIRRRSYFVPPLIYFIPPLSLRFLPPFSPLSFFSFFFLHRLRRFSSFFIRSLENAAQTERTNPPGIVRLGTISLVLNSTQASPLNEIQGCFFLRSTASQAERKKTRATRAFGRLWLIRLPIFFPFYRLIFPRNFWKILKSRPVFFPVEFKNSRIFVPIIENFSISAERIWISKRIPNFNTDFFLFFDERAGERVAKPVRSRYFSSLPPGSLICINHAWDSSFGTRLFAPTPAE